MSFSGGEIYLRQMPGALLSASNEGKSQEDHAIFGSTASLVCSRVGASPCIWRTKEASNNTGIQKEQVQQLSRAWHWKW